MTDDALKMYYQAATETLIRSLASPKEVHPTTMTNHHQHKHDYGPAIVALIILAAFALMLWCPIHGLKPDWLLAQQRVEEKIAHEAHP